MEQKLTELVERLKKAFGDRLTSVLLYGSGAMQDWHPGSSDLNVLCVVDRLSPEELGAAEPVMRWWRDAGNPPPLLLTAEEVRTSTDCFPMEFHDMQQHRRVLHGEDVLTGLTVDDKYYRAQVEHELRAKQLRLRQRAAEVLSDPKRLQTLMIDSVSTFCVLGRHALILSGNPPQWKKKDVVAALGQTIGSPLKGIDEILAIRALDKRERGTGSVLLLGQYLADVAALVHFVDALGT